jgi:hypothetical protein
MSAGLPPGWEQHVSRSTGSVYYFNSTTGETTYDPPPGASLGDVSGDGGAALAPAFGDRGTASNLAAAAAVDKKAAKEAARQQKAAAKQAKQEAKAAAKQAKQHAKAAAKTEAKAAAAATAATEGDDERPTGAGVMPTPDRYGGDGGDRDGGDEHIGGGKASVAQPDFRGQWQQHVSSTGDVYWFNELTGESTYDTPPGLGSGDNDAPEFSDLSSMDDLEEERAHDFDVGGVARGRSPGARRGRAGGTGAGGGCCGSRPRSGPAHAETDNDDNDDDDDDKAPPPPSFDVDGYDDGYDASRPQNARTQPVSGGAAAQYDGVAGQESKDGGAAAGAPVVVAEPDQPAPTSAPDQATQVAQAQAARRAKLENIQYSSGIGAYMRAQGGGGGESGLQRNICLV